MTEDLSGIGRVADAVERGTREVRELAVQFVSPMAEEVGQYLADRARIYRYQATIRALQKAREQLASCGIKPRSIELKRLIPMLEGASLEEDERLVSQWAGLIASAATGSDTLPAFAEILRQLTREEARMLEFIHDNSEELPVVADGYGLDKRKVQTDSDLTNIQFLIRIQNLHRLELIVQLTRGDLEPVRGTKGWSRSGHVGLTALGEAFVRACRGPARLVTDGN